ncbi:MAG: transporter [Bacteroidales bacterium]|nr:transporter [Bacteroidales bacterium]
MKSKWLVVPCFLIINWVIPVEGITQELEPRSLVNLPVGTNFIAAGYGYGQGNILIDPSIPLENFDGKLHTFVAAYLRSINFFGLSGKVDIVLPYGTGDWNYNYLGVDEYDKSDGFGDLRLRLSLNFIGAPALTREEYKNYKQKTVVGYIGQVIIPTGSYKPEQLPNLGSNRWAFRNQLGISHTMNKWILEAYVALWLYTQNYNYLNGNVLKQQPIAGFKIHLIRLFKKGMWLAADVGYGVGGSAEVNDISLTTHMSTFRFGLTYALPLGENHTLKFTAVSGVRIERGPDFDAFGIAYQYRWNNKK